MRKRMIEQGEIVLRQFLDRNENKVLLSFEKDAFSMKAKHVLVISRYQNEWLLTKHPQRGLEFPGGKIEAGESIEDAAKREVYEETGGIVQEMEIIGEYLVEDKKAGAFVKAIVFAHIEKIEQKEDYMETRGPVLIKRNLESELNGNQYSFIMKDEVVLASLSFIKKQLLYK